MEGLSDLSPFLFLLGKCLLITKFEMGVPKTRALEVEEKDNLMLVSSSFYHVNYGMETCNLQSNFIRHR